MKKFPVRVIYFPRYDILTTKIVDYKQGSICGNLVRLTDTPYQIRPERRQTVFNKMPDDWSELMKILFFLYALFLFVHSDVFMDNLLSKINGTVSGRSPTTKGILIQGMFLILVFAIILMGLEGDML